METIGFDLVTHGPGCVMLFGFSDEFTPMLDLLVVLFLHILLKLEHFLLPLRPLLLFIKEV